MGKQKQVFLSFRATEQQAEKVATFAERAGVNASELLRRLVDTVEDVQPGRWDFVLAGQSKQSKTTKNKNAVSLLQGSDGALVEVNP